MPNLIKYSTSTQSAAMKSGNFWIGTESKGETSLSGYWNGITPPSSGYTLYINKVSNGPAIYCAGTPEDLVDLTNSLFSTRLSTSMQCLLYFATQSDAMVLNRDYEPIITNGLMMNLDSSFAPSYPTGGNTWYDISGSASNNGTISGPTYSSNSLGGDITFDGVDDIITIGSGNNYPFPYHTWEIWVKSSGLGPSMIDNGLFGFDYGRLLFIKGSGLLSYVVQSDPSTVLINTNVSTTNVNLYDNYYHHIVCTRGVASYSVYVDGILKESGGSGSPTWSGLNSWSSMNARIGDNPNNNTYKLSGSVAAARVYNRALTSAEVLNNYRASLYRFTNNIITNDLVLYLDAGYLPSYVTSSSIWIDKSGSSTIGTLTNGPTYSATASGSIIFDGVNDYVNITPYVNYTNLTLEAYVYRDDSTDLVNIVFGAGVIEYFGVFHGTLAYYSSVETSNWYYGVTILQPQTWYHVAITYDYVSNVVKLYLNGRLESTSTAASGHRSGDFRVIGSYSGSQRFWKGRIATLRMYNKVLSAPELLQNYQGSFSRFLGQDVATLGLILYLDAGYNSSYESKEWNIWNTSYALGATWSDISGLGNNTQLVNGPTYSSSDGGTIVFDGTNDYTSNTGIILGNYNNFTVSVWIKFDIASRYEVIWSSYLGYFGLLKFPTNIYFAVSGTTGAAAVSTSKMVPGAWYNITAIRRNGWSYLYINGKLEGSFYGAVAGTGATSEYRLGNYTSSYHLDGSISSNMIYNRALSSSEVVRNYRAMLPRFTGDNIVTSGIVMYLDAGYTQSYSAAGATWSNISGATSNDGILTNGPTYSSYYGGSIGFDGVNDYISIPTYTFGNGNWTVSMWVNPNSITSAYNFIISNSNPGPVTNAFGFNLGKIFYRNYNGTWQYHSGNTNTYKDTWYMATWVNSSGVMQMFLNGVSDSATFSSITNNGGPCDVIGRGWATWFAGKIGNVIIYDKSLTSAEVLKNYNAQVLRYKNYITNGDFRLGNFNFTVGATANSSVVLPGASYSLQVTGAQYSTLISDNFVAVDTSKSYQYTTYTRTLTKGGSASDVLASGHVGYACFDAKQREIYPPNLGGIANTVLTRALVAGDSYAYVSSTNNQWATASQPYYSRYFMIYPPTHPEFSKKWEYTRIGNGDFNLYYSDVVDIGGGELRLTLSNHLDVPTVFPNIGYATPIGTGVMNGRSGSSYNYVFYPTTGAFGSWSEYVSPVFSGEFGPLASAYQFRYGTKYIKFIHLVNYGVPGGTSPLPVMLIGAAELKRIRQ